MRKLKKLLLATVLAGALLAGAPQHQASAFVLPSLGGMGEPRPLYGPPGPVFWIILNILCPSC